MTGMIMCSQYGITPFNLMMLKIKNTGGLSVSQDHP